MAYIEDFITSFFEFTDEITLEDVTISPVSRSNTPLQIRFDTRIRFAADSLLIPSTEELDNLLLSAFQEPAVSTLLILLGNLPQENPFSTTQSVSYIMVPTTRSQSQTASGSLSSLGIGALAASISLVLGMCGVMAIRRFYRGDGLRRYKPAPTEEGPPAGSDSGGEMDSTSIDSPSEGSVALELQGGVKEEHTIEFEKQQHLYDPLFQPEVSPRCNI